MGSVIGIALCLGPLFGVPLVLGIRLLRHARPTALRRFAGLLSLKPLIVFPFFLPLGPLVFFPLPLIPLGLTLLICWICWAAFRQHGARAAWLLLGLDLFGIGNAWFLIFWSPSIEQAGNGIPIVLSLASVAVTIVFPFIFPIIATKCCNERAETLPYESAATW